MAEDCVLYAISERTWFSTIGSVFEDFVTSLIALPLSFFLGEIKDVSLGGFGRFSVFISPEILTFICNFPD